MAVSRYIKSLLDQNSTRIKNVTESWKNTTHTRITRTVYGELRLANVSSPSNEKFSGSISGQLTRNKPQTHLRVSQWIIETLSPEMAEKNITLNFHHHNIISIWRTQQNFTTSAASGHMINKLKCGLQVNLTEKGKECIWIVFYPKIKNIKLHFSIRWISWYRMCKCVNFV